MANGPAPWVLVTGATDGIGRETARQLLARGARVIVHGRSEARIAETLEALGHKGSVHSLDSARADLADLDQVRAMAASLADRGRAIDVLINNAGVFLRDETRTGQGFDATMAINHLAPFLLTHLLLANRAGRSIARIVNVSSDASRNGRLDPDDPGGLRMHGGGYAAYCASKLANVWFTAELAQRLRARSVTVNALHPGVVSTKLLTEGFGGRGPDSVESAAAPSVRLALAPELATTTAQYFSRLSAGVPIRVDPKQASRFYEASAATVGVEPLSEG